MKTFDSIRDTLLSAPRVRVTGARTKPALSSVPDGAAALDMTGCRGITEYQPGEFTFTARAGAPRTEISETLARHGQYLPFDPPLARHGATLGGTIAAGLSGSGRLRFGGLRDFIIGATFFTGDGRLVRGGGTVVKNAAGFDFPKLLVGSAGRLGVILEATFKVFPRPEECLTACARTGSLAAALALLARLVRLPADLDALDLEPDGRVWIRLAGNQGTLAPRLRRLASETTAPFEPADEIDWPGSRIGDSLTIKIPLTPARIPEFDIALAAHGVSRVYTLAGQTAWIAFPEDRSTDLDATLRSQGLGGLSLRSTPAHLGNWPAPQAQAIVQRVFDPDGRLV